MTKRPARSPSTPAIMPGSRANQSTMELIMSGMIEFPTSESASEVKILITPSTKPWTKVRMLSMAGPK